MTIVLLTPLAISHKRDSYGNYNDWMYDEIRCSLENRDNNRTNGLVAVYTPEAANLLVGKGTNGTIEVYDVDNLFRKNMMNVKPQYKTNPKVGIYDSNYDSYCSLVPWNSFISDLSKYIDIAAEKREETYKYDIVKRL